MTQADLSPSTDFIRDIINEDNRTGKFANRVHTRFPPEPNGYLHIGHAKSITLNFGVARDYGGLCNLRFDDTNPTKEEVEYVDSIQADVRWLGFDWEERQFYASDYFEQLYNFAVQLIKKGKAYVCDLTADEMREYRGTLTQPGVNSPYRERSIEANLDLLSLAGGEHASPLVRTILGSFALPGTRFVLNVSGVDVFVDANESMFGEPLQQKRIEPVVKSELAAKNFSFVEEKSKASLLITITADVRKGTESFGLAFAFASATVSVLDLETAQELYKSSLSDIKEGSDTFEKAAYKALNTLSARIVRDMLPHLVDKVQK